MIKIFRKIRYKLMSENKTSRYFKYAIGEIILVVIGILIALQVNNINSNSKIKRSAKEHITILIENLKEDQIALNDLINKLDVQLKSANSVLDYYKLKHPKSNSLLNHITELLWELNLKSNSNGYELLVNTGEISTLSSALQNLITGYRKHIKYIAEREFISNTFIQDKYENHLFDVHPHIFRKGNENTTISEFYKDDLRKPISISDFDIKNDRKLESLIFGRRFQVSQQLEAYKNGYKLGGELISKLQKIAIDD